jgi:enediyne biosynthesis protein E7
VRDAPELRVDRSLSTALRVIGADRLRWIDEAAALGPVTALRLGPLTAWVISDPHLARQMLVTDGASWIRPPTLVVPIRVAVGENLFTQPDRAWGRLEPDLAPAFRKSALHERLATLDPLIADQVGALPLDTTVDVDLATAQLALIGAAWVLFGEQLDGTQARELADHQRAVTGWIGPQVGKLGAVVPLAPGASGRAMRHHRAALRAYADDVIARAANGQLQADVLGALLRARPSGKTLTARQLRGHVLGLLLAGNDTTAAALSWAIVHGARHPDHWRRLRDDPARHTLPFIHETLRLTPPVWGFSRTPATGRASVTVGEVAARIRRHQVATIYLRGIHRDPASWPDPLAFDPSRHDLARGAAPHGPLLAFGLGPRGCIGQQLALAELAAVLPALARHADVAVNQPITEDASFSLRVRGGVTGRFRRPRAHR